jgi:hypothetical protein
MQAKTIQINATMAIGFENLPKYHGPGTNILSPLKTRQAIGIAYATSWRIKEDQRSEN